MKYIYSHDCLCGNYKHILLSHSIIHAPKVMVVVCMMGRPWTHCKKEEQLEN